MSKCSKVKNPCKICLGPVSHKNGLQCEGACKSWAHYSCLNYTPGKIKDIKAGIIKVACPCPDCSTAAPKEFRTDEPFTCSNIGCPANQSPKCENNACPVNKNQPNFSPVGPISCGRECKSYGNPPPSCPPSPCPPSPCPPPPCPPSPPPCKVSNQRQRMPAQNSMDDGCFGKAQKECPSGCSPVAMATNNSRPASANQPIDAVAEMVGTVGQLTTQINCLMKQLQCQMGQMEQEGCPKESCPNAPKTICPKPCYCPGNPQRKHR